MQQNKTVLFPGFHRNFDKSKWLLDSERKQQTKIRRLCARAIKNSTSCLKDRARVPYEHCFVTSWNTRQLPGGYQCNTCARFAYPTRLCGWEADNLYANYIATSSKFEIHFMVLPLQCRSSMLHIILRWIFVMGPCFRPIARFRFRRVHVVFCGIVFCAVYIVLYQDIGITLPALELNEKGFEPPLR